MKSSCKLREIVRQAKFDVVCDEDCPEFFDVVSKAVGYFCRVREDGHCRFLDADYRESVFRYGLNQKEFTLDTDEDLVWLSV